MYSSFLTVSLTFSTGLLSVLARTCFSVLTLASFFLKSAVMIRSSLIVEKPPCETSPVVEKENNMYFEILFVIELE